MNIYDLETPCVLLDIQRVENNIQRAQQRCNALGLTLRPHIKTHKIPEIARMQVDAGAIGIACQKVSEAEVFAKAGFDDIQIPYNIVGEKKADRLVALTVYNRVTVSADHSSVLMGLSAAAKRLDMTVRVMLELETHLERTGAQPEEMVALAERIEPDENLHFAGVMLYPSEPGNRPKLQKALRLLDEAGLGVDCISGGGTGAIKVAEQMPEVTEIRVGTYVFNDMTCVTKGWADQDDCALTVAATVVSRPTSDRMILDAGSKTIAADTIAGGHGYILEHPDAFIYGLSEEHAHVDISKVRQPPSIGERVHIIPVHACVVMNLHDTVYGHMGEKVETEWSVAARGKVQ